MQAFHANVSTLIDQTANLLYSNKTMIPASSRSLSGKLFRIQQQQPAPPPAPTTQQTATGAALAAAGGVIVAAGAALSNLTGGAAGSTVAQGTAVVLVAAGTGVALVGVVLIVGAYIAYESQQDNEEARRSVVA